MPDTCLCEIPLDLWQEGWGLWPVPVPHTHHLASGPPTPLVNVLSLGTCTRTHGGLGVGQLPAPHSHLADSFFTFAGTRRHFGVTQIPGESRIRRPPCPISAQLWSRGQGHSHLLLCPLPQHLPRLGVGLAIILGRPWGWLVHLEGLVTPGKSCCLRRCHRALGPAQFLLP